MAQSFWKRVWQFLTKLNMQLPYNSTITLLEIILGKWKLVFTHKNLLTNIYSCFICHSPKLETTQMFAAFE